MPPAGRPVTGEGAPRRTVPAAGQYLTIQVIRALFVIISASLGWEVARTVSGEPNWYHPANVLGLGVGLVLGLVLVAAEILTSKRFAASIFAVVVGLLLGFIGSYLFTQGLLLIPHFRLIKENPKLLEALKLAVTLVFCYLAIVVVFQGKDRFKLIIPFVESEMAPQRPVPWVLDTSVIIDGRVGGVLEAIRVDGAVVVPGFVVDEIQTLADSRDRQKRQRGRRGLDILGELKRSRKLQVELDETRLPAGGAVDAALLDLAHKRGARVVSNDTALHKVAQLQGLRCLSLNELFEALKSVVMPGEDLSVTLVRPGEQPDQGLGFLEDGTMVVVEHSRSKIGQTVAATVTSVLQTQSGRMIFGKLRDHGS